MKRRSQLEEALKAAGAPPEALRLLTGQYFDIFQKTLYIKIDRFI